MPAIVRVKRRIDEEPLNAFLLNGKKRRIEDGGEVAAIDNTILDNKETKDQISTKLKFVGTINEQNDTSQIIRLTKDAAKNMIEQKTTSRTTINHTERARNETRQAAHEQRFRVVNCMRTTLEDEPAETNVDTSSTNSASNEVTIVDIEKEKTKKIPNTTTPNRPEPDVITTGPILPTDRPSDSDSGYVYDLYLPENEQLVDDVDLMDDYLSVRPVNELIYEDYYRDNEESDCETEDSNEENYYTNDYPDEDDDSSLSDRDDDARFVEGLSSAIAGFVLDDVDPEMDKDSYAECSSDEDEFYERNNIVDCYYDSVSDAEGDIDCDSDRNTDLDERFHSASENGEDETKI